MPVELGAAFRPRIIEVLPIEPQYTVEDLRAEQLLTALRQLESALHHMPQPQIHVAEPDLSAIVTAVTSLKGPATADEIAAAVVSQIGGDTQRPIEPVLEELTAALKTLDFRLKGIGSTGGGGGSSVQTNLVSYSGRSIATSDLEVDTRFEWQSVAATSVPLYSGTATPGTASSAGDWKVEKFTYITGPAGDAVPSLIQTKFGVWDNRAALF